MNLKELVSLNGRMRRKHYLAIYFVALAVIIVIGLLERATGYSLSILTFTVIAALIPSTVRRLHDMGYSGWLVIGVIAVPFVSLLLLSAPGVPGANAYGINPKTQTP